MEPSSRPDLAITAELSTILQFANGTLPTRHLLGPRGELSGDFAVLGLLTGVLRLRPEVNYPFNRREIWTALEGKDT